jgi:hypothetical protein
MSGPTRKLQHHWFGVRFHRRLPVRDEEYQLLLAACQQMAHNWPRLQLIQKETAEGSAKSIDHEIESFLGGVFQDRQRISSAAVDAMQPLLMVYDFALLQICDLSYFAWANKSSRVKLIWPSADLPARPRTTDVFYLLVSNLAQLLQAVRLLLLNGFEGQGRAMFRSFVELADLTLAVLADEHVYRNYITNYDDPDKDYHHWRRYLAPTVMRRRLKRLDNELDIGSTTAIPASEVREDTYSWFSLFAHVNFVAHFVTAHPMPLGEEDAAAPLAMLGEVGEMTRSTFARALLYIWIFFCHFDRLLWGTAPLGSFSGREVAGLVSIPRTSLRHAISTELSEIAENCRGRRLKQI